MKPLVNYEIPNEIHFMESNHDPSILKKYQEMVDKSRFDETSYITAFKNMIYMEEFANTNHIAGYDIHDAQIHLISRSDQTFRVMFDPTVRNLAKARRDLDGLSICNHALANSSMIFGKIIGCEEEFLFFRIVDGFEDLMQIYDNDDTETFIIKFFMNRLAFQIQHNALKWFADHNLHAVLINNPEYDSFEQSTTNLGYKFR